MLFAGAVERRDVAHSESATPSIPVTTYVFVDVNRSGDFEAASDLFIELLGTADLTQNNFVF